MSVGVMKVRDLHDSYTLHEVNNRNVYECVKLFVDYKTRKCFNINR
jgi:hypothetical protein